MASENKRTENESKQRVNGFQEKKNCLLKVKRYRMLRAKS